MTDFRIRRTGSTTYRTGSEWGPIENASIYTSHVTDMIPLPEDGVWEEVGPQSYRVTVTIEIDAKDRHQAAMRAYSILKDETPRTFDTKDTGSISEEVNLTEDDAKQALDLAFEGALFEA